MNKFEEMNKYDAILVIQPIVWRQYAALINDQNTELLLALNLVYALNKDETHNDIKIK